MPQIYKRTSTILKDELKASSPPSTMVGEGPCEDGKPTSFLLLKESITGGNTVISQGSR